MGACLKGAEGLSRVPGHAKYWFNVCRALAEGLCMCKGGGETEGFSEVEGRLEKYVEPMFPELF